MAAIYLIGGAFGQRIRIKPSKDEASNGCGFCCSTGTYGVAREFIPDHPEDGPCLAVEWEVGRFLYRIIRRLGPYRRLPNNRADDALAAMIADGLRADWGCDADV